jgi:hypothetical protein
VAGQAFVEGALAFLDVLRCGLLQNREVGGRGDKGGHHKQGTCHFRISLFRMRHRREWMRRGRHVGNVEARLAEPVNGARGMIDRHCMPVLPRSKIIPDHAPATAARYNLAL